MTIEEKTMKWGEANTSRKDITRVTWCWEAYLQCLEECLGLIEFSDLLHVPWL